MQQPAASFKLQDRIQEGQGRPSWILTVSHHYSKTVWTVWTRLQYVAPDGCTGGEVGVVSNPDLFHDSSIVSNQANPGSESLRSQLRFFLLVMETFISDCGSTVAVQQSQR
jgi:hypothetical protein